MLAAPAGRTAAVATRLRAARGSPTAAENLSLLEGMELGGARLYTQVLGDDAPAVALVGLVLCHDPLRRLFSQLGRPQDHIGIGGLRDGSDDGLDLGLRNAEACAELDPETGDVSLRLHVHAGEEPELIGKRRACVECSDRRP